MQLPVQAYGGGPVAQSSMRLTEQDALLLGAQGFHKVRPFGPVGYKNGPIR